MFLLLLVLLLCYSLFNHTLFLTSLITRKKNSNRIFDCVLSLQSLPRLFTHLHRWHICKIVMSSVRSPFWFSYTYYILRVQQRFVVYFAVNPFGWLFDLIEKQYKWHVTVHCPFNDSIEYYKHFEDTFAIDLSVFIRSFKDQGRCSRMATEWGPDIG